MSHGSSFRTDTADPDAFDAYIASSRTKLLPQLSKEGHGVYLDAAAAPLFPSAPVISALQQDLTTNLYSNPHSGAPAARRTARVIEEVRKQVLSQIFRLDDDAASQWDLVFTSGATASLKLVAESFDWGGQAGRHATACGNRGRGSLIYLSQSHTSLSGLRSYALLHGAEVQPLDACDLAIAVQRRSRAASANRLVALPLQCNATGRRYTDLLKDIASQAPSTHADITRVFTLVDASAFLSSSSHWPTEHIPLDGPCVPDFIAFSFYKIFGYPTGLGGLLVRRSADVHAALNGKHYFGGGTLALSLSYQNPAETPTSADRAKTLSTPSTVPSRDILRRLEDGTLNFYDIIALKHAIEVHQKLLQPPSGNLAESFRPLTAPSYDEKSWQLRRAHVKRLTRRLYLGLGALQHLIHTSKGVTAQPLVKVYTDSVAGRRWFEQGHRWALTHPITSRSDWAGRTDWMEQLELESNGPEAEEVDDQGPVALFNLLSPSRSESPADADASIISPFEVGRLASLLSIHLRVGRHCNAGVMEDVVGVSRQRMWALWNENGVGCVGEEDEAETESKDDDAPPGPPHLKPDADILARSSSSDGHPAAAIRASICTWNTRDDVDIFIGFLSKFFMAQRIGPMNALREGTEETSGQPGSDRSGAYLQSITIYPIKSCTGQHIGKSYNTASRSQSTHWTTQASCTICRCTLLTPVYQRSGDVLRTFSSASSHSFSSDGSHRTSSSIDSDECLNTPESSLPPSSECGDASTRCGDDFPSPSPDKSWPLTPHGLLHDREWCLVKTSDHPGGKLKVLSQKRFTRMALIQARIQRCLGQADEQCTDTGCEDSGTLVIDLMREGGTECEKRILVRFKDGDEPACRTASCPQRGASDSADQRLDRPVRMCAEIANGTASSDGPQLHPCLIVEEALSAFLDVDCTLARLSSALGRHRHSNLSLVTDGRDGAGDAAESAAEIPILLSNESPFLMVNQSSVDLVRQWVQDDAGNAAERGQDWSHINASCFRPNFVIGGRMRAVSDQSKHDHPEALPEDGLRRLQVGPHVFGGLGPCRRCEMVGIDQETGERVPELLAALSKRRRRLAEDGQGAKRGAGRVEFGEHLHWLPHSGNDDKQDRTMIRVGMKVTMY